MKAMATKARLTTTAQAMARAARSSLAVLAIAAACTPHGDDTGRRIAALEQQVAAQQRALDDLRRVVTAAPELTSILERLDELTEKVGQLQNRPVAAAPHRRPEPDPKIVYAVPVGTSAVTGSANAKVTIVMAGEFACPYCRKAWDTVDELRKKYGADLRVVYKSFIVHPQRATLAAQAACAANHQGKWRQMAELLWAKAFDAQMDNDHSFERANMDAIATEAKLDMKRYRADFDGVCPSELKAEQDEMTRLGVGATPTFFINGRYIAGAQPIQNFAAIIDEEMEKANDAIKGGVKPATYYDQEIVGKGRKQLNGDLEPNPF
jgi:protein-disulfide isomerase